jgi:hypothetical protein
MKRILCLLLLPLVTAQAGLIFDNGTGGKNDTLTLQFCFVDSLGLDYAAWDTVYIKQCYGSVAFRESTLTSPTTYDIGNSWPSTVMFEWRAPASNSNGDIGAYTWWALVTKNYNNKRVRHLHKGWYYVNDDGLDEYLAIGDTASNTALGKAIRDAVGDSIPSIADNILSSPTFRLATDANGYVSLSSGGLPLSLTTKIDSIRWALGMPMSVAGEKYEDNLHRKLGPYLGGISGNVKNDIDALSLTGAGSESCTLIARQNGLTAIVGAKITVRTLGDFATRVPGLCTDINGRGVAELDPSDYYLSITANNYFPLIDTITVTRDSVWNFSLTPFDPGAPPSPGLCRVYGWVYDISGNKLSGAAIKAEIPSSYQPLKYDGVMITPYKRETASDTLGYWQLDLIPNADLSKPDSRYQFTIEYPSGTIYKTKTTVPNTLSWQLE